MTILNFLLRLKMSERAIEDKNEICINVFSYEEKIVCPVYVSKKEYDNCISLLIIHEGDK